MQRRASRTSLGREIRVGGELKENLTGLTRVFVNRNGYIDNDASQIWICRDLSGLFLSRVGGSLE